jgi:hypothetical protein
LPQEGSLGLLVFDLARCAQRLPKLAQPFLGLVLLPRRNWAITWNARLTGSIVVELFERAAPVNVLSPIPRLGCPLTVRMGQ